MQNLPGFPAAFSGQALLQRFLSAFLGTSSDDAITILSMPYPDNMADGVFVLATERANRLYGQNLCPGKGKNVWISTTQTPETFRRVQMLWAARHCTAEGAPTSYLTDIIRPRGGNVTVYKTTLEVVEDGSRYWITLLKESTQVGDIPHIQDIRIKVDYRHRMGLKGKPTMAQLHTLSQSMVFERDVLTATHYKPYTDSVKEKSQLTRRNGTVNVTPQDIPPSFIVLKPGTAEIHVPNPQHERPQPTYYIHGPCKKCGVRWVGTSLDPKRCWECQHWHWRMTEEESEEEKVEGNP